MDCVTVLLVGALVRVLHVVEPNCTVLSLQKGVVIACTHANEGAALCCSFAVVEIDTPATQELAFALSVG